MLPLARSSVLRIAALVATMLPASLALGAAATTPSALAGYRDVVRRTAAEGVVEAVRQSALAAQVAGRVVAVPVKPGDRVGGGQVLVQIDPRFAAQAEAASRSQVREAQANLANAKAKYDRSSQLFAQKFISQAALEQARADYLAAQAQTAAAQSNAAASATSKSYTTIVAPYDGVVSAVDVEVGDVATPGRALVTVFDPRALRVTATLPQAVLARTDLAAPVEIDVPALGRSFVAKRATVIPVADVRTHTTQVRFDVGDEPGLMPGQFARASVATGRLHALTVPVTAVFHRSEVTAVYVLDVQGRAELRQVRLGEALRDGQVEILAGLEAGERVSLAPVRSGIEASAADATP